MVCVCVCVCACVYLCMFAVFAYSTQLDVSKSDMVPQAIFNAVWKDNMQFLEDKNIFDQQYFSFLWNVLSSYTFDPVNGCILQHSLSFGWFPSKRQWPDWWISNILCPKWVQSLES